MEEKYAVVRIQSGSAMGYIFEWVELNFFTAADAYTYKSALPNPEHYIIINYYQ